MQRPRAQVCRSVAAGRRRAAQRAATNAADQLDVVTGLLSCLDPSVTADQVERL